MAQDARSRSPLPHSLAALVLLLCAATGTGVRLAAALTVGARPGGAGLPGGLAVELPLLAAASVVSPVGALVLDGLLGMPPPDLASPAVLVLSAAGLLLTAGPCGPARPAPPHRVARRRPGCRSLRPGPGLELEPVRPRRAWSCGRRPGSQGSAPSPG